MSSISPFQVQSSLDQLYSAMEALVRQRSADVQLVNSYLGRWERNIWSRFEKKLSLRCCSFGWDVFLYGFGRLSFSRMRSKGSRFTLGVWGLRVCSLDVAFVVATVRNRPQLFARSPYGRAYGKFCRGGPFWRFQTCRCFVSRGRRGTS